MKNRKYKQFKKRRIFVDCANNPHIIFSKKHTILTLLERKMADEVAREWDRIIFNKLMAMAAIRDAIFPSRNNPFVL